MDPFDILQIPTEELERLPTHVKAIDLLFTQGKYTAKTFLIGTQKQIFYGQPSTMTINSTLISTIPDWKEDVTLATHITLTDENLKGFIVVWLLINDLYPWEIEQHNSFKDVLVIIEWMNYFGYDKNVVNIWEHYIRDHHNNPPELDDTSKELIEKRYNKALELCKSDPIKYKNQCYYAMQYAHILKISSEEIELMGKYGGETALDLSTFIMNNMDTYTSLNTTQMKWGNIGLNYQLEAFKDAKRIDLYSRAEIGELANLLGRRKDSDVKKILSLPE